jgi:hypothetical protein
MNPLQVRRGVAAAVVVISSAFVSSSRSAAMLTGVPDRLQPSQSLKTYPVGDIRLRALDLSTIPVKESVELLSISQVARNQAGSVGSVAFVVRRPG